MDEQQNLERLRSTCSGIRRFYLARQAGIDSMVEEREHIAQRARDARAQERQESDPIKKNFIKREVSSLVSELSSTDRSIGTKLRQLTEYQSDYELNQCPALFGSLD